MNTSAVTYYTVKYKGNKETTFDHSFVISWGAWPFDSKFMEFKCKDNKTLIVKKKNIVSIKTGME
jgi:hypothetical protein